MNNIQIIHNPGSGDENHSKENLLRLFNSFSEEVNYVSTEEEAWEENCRTGAEAIYIAGGDGTVRKVAQSLLKQQQPNHKLPPLGLLPLGTANNIAETLGIPFRKENVEFIPFGERVPFDRGHIKGLAQETFFMESVGVGIFPELLCQDEEQEIEGLTPEAEIKNALKHLRKIVEEYEGGRAKIKADGIKIKGKFLLVELMNIKFIGPNLPFAPEADPGDAYFDLVLIPQNKKRDFLLYLDKRIKGKSEPEDLNFLKTLKVQKVSLQWKGSKLHVDDELIQDYDGKKIKIKMVPGAFEFFK